MSAFSRKLALDPILRKHTDEVVRVLRAAVRPEIEAIERSERLLPRDLDKIPLL